MDYMVRTIRRGLRSPILWGSCASLGFYMLIEAQVIHGEFAFRYFCSHPVEHISMTIFFVAMATLLVKGSDVVAQLKLPKESLLPVAPLGEAEPSDSETLLHGLAKLAAPFRDGLLGRRLVAALEHIQRKGSTETLDADLRDLADRDAQVASGSYSLIRIIIWAIPILGFLGTVMGITMAIAEISPQQLEESMPAVTAGLAVAFDTTALALGLSMVLMFAQFIVDRAEQRLLAEVDDRASRELVGRFKNHEIAADPNSAAVRRMGEAVIQATERLVHRQAEVWRATIDAAHEHWQGLAASATHQTEQSLSAALSTSLKAHAEHLTAAEQSAAEKSREHWNRLSQTFAESALAVRDQQRELVEHSKLLVDVVTATGQVARLEEALNRNLAGLAGSQSLEQTLLSLSTAAQLLVARLGQLPAGSQIELKREPRMGQAA